MDLELSGKRALISGSTSGIGYAIAKSLAAEGADVIITGRNEKHIETAIKGIVSQTSEAKVAGVVADFGNANEIDNLLKTVGDVDILINNVGIFEPKDFLEITDEDWKTFFEINVLSGVRLSRFYFPKMLSKNWGRIIFISSESAINIPEEMIHYGATKTTQLGLSRGLAKLTRGTAVTVNAVLPGPTKSDGVNAFLSDLAKGQGISKEEVEKDFFRNARPSSLIQRFASIEEIASLVVYLSSPLSSAVNGASLRIDGGVVNTIV